MTEQQVEWIIEANAILISVIFGGGFLGVIDWPLVINTSISLVVLATIYIAYLRYTDGESPFSQYMRKMEEGSDQEPHPFKEASR